MMVMVKVMVTVTVTVTVTHMGSSGMGERAAGERGGSDDEDNAHGFLGYDGAGLVERVGPHAVHELVVQVPADVAVRPGGPLHPVQMLAGRNRVWKEVEGDQRLVLRGEGARGRGGAVGESASVCTALHCIALHCADHGPGL